MQPAQEVLRAAPPGICVPKTGLLAEQFLSSNHWLFGDVTFGKVPIKSLDTYPKNLDANFDKNQTYRC
jgi:hypothetical protein